MARPTRTRHVWTTRLLLPPKLFMELPSILEIDARRHTRVRREWMQSYQIRGEGSERPSRCKADRRNSAMAVVNARGYSDLGMANACSRMSRWPGTRKV